jgi:hypothetical protein
MNLMNRIVIGVFLIFIGVITCMHILSKDVSFSEAENRVLSDFPKFTMDRFIAGTFTKDFEVYLSDQFAKKEFWTGLKAKAEKGKLKKENNGVFWGKDGYLLERFEKPDDQLKKNMESLMYYTKKASDVSSYLMLVPTSVGIYPEKLPLFAQTENQEDVLAGIKHQLSGSIRWIDTYNALVQSKKEQIYFHTDHHWTSRGAYVSYKAAAKALGFTPYAEDEFAIETVSDTFYGTHYAKVNDHSIHADTIEIYKPKFDVSYQVDIEDGQATMDTLYDWSYLKKRDQYAFFLSGNHSNVKIKSSVKNGRKLVLIKDSYAHMMVPFLANHFEEIHMIDLRYYHGNLYHYLAQNEIDDVLFLYNIATFSQDPNLVWLRQ